MKCIISSIVIGIVFFAADRSLAQSIFSTKEDVADYLEGEWNLDVVRGGFAGGTYFLPSPYYFDSTTHGIMFEKSGIDSTPLICKAFINDTLFEQTYVKISENPSQIILPRWLLYDLPQNLEGNTRVMESEGFYGFSMDTIVLQGTVIDGYEFGLTRLVTNTDDTHQQRQIHTYPNPSDGRIFIEGIVRNAPFELYSIDGKRVNMGELNDNVLNLENDGLYILKIKIQDSWLPKTIVVKK